ncbi:RidA family protein [Actibacterium ureilyticum]|uniref:RidA family protein n=1 Tax=Actibacterium ureilyticum TaxID=1590614 RepID=UPI000BAAC3F4|nr:RidA family protein [Actibacterium ureilyticum]
MAIRRITTGSPFEPKVGYARAVVADGLVHVSGCTGADPETGVIPTDVVDQCRNTLATIEKALKAAGSDFTQALRVNYILPDRADFEPCWPLLRAAFGDNPPAATMIQAGLIVPEMKIEIEVTARAPA